MGMIEKSKDLAFWKHPWGYSLYNKSCLVVQVYRREWQIMRNGEKISLLWETHQRWKKRKEIKYILLLVYLVALSDHVFFNKQNVYNGPLCVYYTILYCPLYYTILYYSIVNTHTTHIICVVLPGPVHWRSFLYIRSIWVAPARQKFYTSAILLYHLNQLLYWQVLLLKRASWKQACMFDLDCVCL